MRSLRLALLFASRRAAEAIGAVLSVAIGAGSLAAADRLSSESALFRQAGIVALSEAFGALAIATALVSAIGFSAIMKGRMRRRSDRYCMLKAIGATSPSLFATLMAEAFVFALCGAILSLAVSLPLIFLAHADLASTALEGLAGPSLAAKSALNHRGAPNAGFPVWTSLGFSLLIALFAAFPAIQTTRHCTDEATGGDRDSRQHDD
jgi:ABC-type lipoprotein release transport system permease subunit